MKDNKGVNLIDCNENKACETHITDVTAVDVIALITYI